jgi:hypothetical protein
MAAATQHHGDVAGGSWPFLCTLFVFMHEYTPEIFWPLILGFAVSAVVQAVLSHREMARLLPDDGPRSIGSRATNIHASPSFPYRTRLATVAMGAHGCMEG